MDNLASPFEMGLSDRTRPMTFSEFALMLGVSRTTVWREFEDGNFSEEEILILSEGCQITVLGALRYVRDHLHDLSFDADEKDFDFSH